ncbi:phosphate ABC transporter substrate-binding protein PstS [Kitasatospora sp. NPDC048540]|uniref:phosphate ABC transporter substrate-binding protein PstS n=1 Tax=unclassified Kitasatospora TaxID=2633591 RepID=UPI00053AF657|nr:phosphate ABC transporter substrate-binding protein PstS [Kitasatospora sp. MBT63]
MPVRVRSSRIRLLGAALALAFVCAAAGCQSDGGGGSTATSGSGACAGSGQVLGAGSTAQANAIDLWKTAFSALCPAVTVTYGASGSGAGLQQFVQGKVAFAGSDAALGPADVEATRQVCPGGQGIDLPLVAGLISIVHHIDGVDRLVLDGPTLAKIFDSRITSWDDPAIAALNPGVTLPSAGVQAIHRADDSGTTDNLTRYLAAASNGAWPYPPAKAWAGQGGQSATGSAGVAAQVEQTKNSIGYVELSFAGADGLRSAAIRTGAPKPVEATAANAANTIAAAKLSGPGEDLTLAFDYTTDQENAYPLVLVTYEIVCDQGNKPAVLPALRSFLSYAAGDKAQRAIGAQGYVPLPVPIAAQVRATIDGLG